MHKTATCAWVETFSASKASQISSLQFHRSRWRSATPWCLKHPFLRQSEGVMLKRESEVWGARYGVPGIYFEDPILQICNRFWPSILMSHGKLSKNVVALWPTKSTSKILLSFLEKHQPISLQSGTLRPNMLSHIVRHCQTFVSIWYRYHSKTWNARPRDHAILWPRKSTLLLYQLIWQCFIFSPTAFNRALFMNPSLAMPPNLGVAQRHVRLLGVS